MRSLNGGLTASSKVTFSPFTLTRDYALAVEAASAIEVNHEKHAIGLLG